MTYLLLSAVDVPAAVQYPIWAAVVALFLNAFKDYIPFMSDMVGKKKMEEDMKKMEEDMKNMKKKYEELNAKYSDIVAQHDIVINRLEVIMSLDPDNISLNYVIPSKTVDYESKN